ncbi:MAG: hypothetical protein JKY34_10730 [Kordiimonadaceae bacterium]|nr:hypothetical protein [Kordiimonadaceae bacterium]
MLEKIRSILVGLSLIVIAGLLGLYMYVQMGKGSDIFGSQAGALPATNFDTLAHPSSDTGFLLCPDDLCVAAETDGPAATFNVNATALRQALFDFRDSLPTVRNHHVNIRLNQFGFLERLPGEHLPALVSIRILPDTNYTSKIAIYSIMPLGDAGRETDQERVERWVRQITAQVSANALK